MAQVPAGTGVAAGTGGGQGQGMDAMDAAFADDGGDKGTPPPTDEDALGSAMDQASAESDAKEMPADGGKEDSVADTQPEADDGIPKTEEDDKSVDG